MFEKFPSSYFPLYRIANVRLEELKEREKFSLSLQSSERVGMTNGKYDRQERDLQLAKLPRRFKAVNLQNYLYLSLQFCRIRSEMGRFLPLQREKSSAEKEILKRER